MMMMTMMIGVINGNPTNSLHRHDDVPDRPIFLPQAIVPDGSIRPRFFAETVRLAILPFPNVNTPVRPLAFSLTVHLRFLPSPLVDGAIGEFVVAVPVPMSLLEIADVAGLVGPPKFALAVA